MKYYTPHLLAQFGSQDLKASKAARLELEQNADSYVLHLDAIKPKLPPRFGEMQDRFYLHDARVVSPVFPWSQPELLLRFPFMPWCDVRVDGQEFETGHGHLPSFALMLRLAPPPQEFLVLHYRFVAIEQVTHHPALDEGRLTPLEWLHDEADLILVDNHVTFRHSILFTQGLELRLRFQDFDYATLNPQGLPSEASELLVANA